MKIRLLIASVLSSLCSTNVAAQGAAADAAWLVDASGCKFLDPSTDSASGQDSTPRSFRWDGKCVDGFISGPGELRIEHLPILYRGDFANGRIVTGSVQVGPVTYQGEFLDNAPHGRGTMTLPDGRVATGPFEDGHATGRGFEIKWPNGSRYQGDIDRKGYDMEGTGTLTYADGSVYEGEFHDGRLQGNGLMKYAGGAIKRGVFVDGQLEGKGSIHYSNGADFEGEFRAGKPHGQGRMTQADGGVYEGMFADGHYHGKGKLTYGTGDVYEGDFVAGQPQGTGFLKHVTGDTYEGQFVVGRRHGTGRLTFATGGVWEGEWKQDAMYGKCKMSTAQGRIYDGECAADRASGAGHLEDRVAQITYDGGFRNNLYDGHGVLRTKSLEGTDVFYDGEFAQGVMEGAGTLRLGAVQFKGNFKHGLFNGGTIVAESGRTFEVDIEKATVLEVLEGGVKRPIDQLPPDIKI